LPVEQFTIIVPLLQNHQVPATHRAADQNVQREAGRTGAASPGQRTSQSTYLCTKGLVTQNATFILGRVLQQRLTQLGQILI
jgi:hypothetical protein